MRRAHIVLLTLFLVFACALLARATGYYAPLSKTSADNATAINFTLPRGYPNHLIHVETNSTTGTLAVAVQATAASGFITLSTSIDLTAIEPYTLTGSYHGVRFTPSGTSAGSTYTVIMTGWEN